VNDPRVNGGSHAHPRSNPRSPCRTTPSETAPFYFSVSSPTVGEEPANARQLKALLAPYPSTEMTCWPVSVRVGNVKNNDPDLVEPIHLP
jgi:hypothetical protein